jgi:hypothetical protein
MRFLTLLFTIFVFAAPVLSLAQSPDSILVGAWHLDEAAPSVARDSSGYHNSGFADGTSVVPGVKGNGRSFNGTSDFISVTDYYDMLSFLNTQSFRIDFSFKTTATEGVILRKGLAPTPGYQVSLAGGHLVGMIGDRADGAYPDTLLSIVSTQRVDDNVWHRGSFIRDRASHKLLLFIDGSDAATPVEDNVNFALTNDRPLTIGRWENYDLPWFFKGQLDEIRIVRFFTVLSDTQALWHFNEPGPSTALDSSPYGNIVSVFGTTVVPGISGNARHFNGNGEYMWLSQPAPSCFDFGLSTSFTVEAWFKTASANDQQIVMTGAYSDHAAPSWTMKTYGGRAAMFFGNPNPAASGDTYTLMFSKNRVDDNTWHRLTFVRDRGQGKLFLYVDGVLATDPSVDPYPYAMASRRPITIGRWEDPGNPYYFNGTIDEIGIYRGARHPSSDLSPHVSISPAAVNFGKVMVRDSAECILRLSNTGLSDTLRITALDLHPPFSCTPELPILLPPLSSVDVPVHYRPTSVGLDTMSLLLATNDPERHAVSIRLRGSGVGVVANPTILSVVDIPNDQGHKVRIIWLRSAYDGSDSAQSVVGYDVWRKVENNPFAFGAYPAGTQVPGDRVQCATGGALWDFIVTVPQVYFDAYSFVAPTLVDSTVLNGQHQTVFMISARTSGARVLFSDPDSGYAVDNLVPQQPQNLVGSINNGVHLQWNSPSDPDIMLYEIFRGSDLNFAPADANRIGTTRSNNYLDTKTERMLLLK